MATHEVMIAVEEEQEEQEEGIDETEEEDDGRFICGVCEGFYGKPWTKQQRIELFSRMQRFQLNCYLYAPKDDCKHRLYWRDQYTDEEAADIKELVDDAREKRVTFVYAISPGLDITYTNEKDITFLKEKLEQVKKCGCTNFALLFDDIEPAMCNDDKAKYDSVAHAQCELTNNIFNWLNPDPDPDVVFLFCPTEYCDSRTVPSLRKSSYLATIGEKLRKEIIITWTGNHVVPRIISRQDIEDLTEIIQRKPMIWENLFANDYDQTRLYLGPYDGRSFELKPDLAGVLLNPNCEFEMNFVAMHTTAQWQLNRVQRFPLKGLPQAPTVPGEDVEMADAAESTESTEYNPRIALKRALEDWLEEFYKRPEYSRHQTHRLEGRKGIAVDDNDKMETEGKEETIEGKDEEKHKQKKTLSELEELSVDDLLILSDLFCLPFDYGPRAVHFLKEAHWLMSNLKDPLKGKGEWSSRANDFQEFYRTLAILADKVINIPNRDILYDLYCYLSDIRSTLCLINSYIKWCGLGNPNRESFRSGDREPWLYRGGLHGEFRRLLPTEGRNDMFPRKEIRRSTSRFFTVRPYFSSDKDALYTVCRLTWDGGLDCLDIKHEEHPDLYADELVGGFLRKSSDLCYVLEDELSVCGFAVAAVDATEFHKKLKDEWQRAIDKDNEKNMPQEFQQKSRKGKTKKTSRKIPSKEPVAHSFDKIAHFPSIVHLRVRYNRLEAQSPADQLLSCITKALKDKGSKGMHTKIQKSHKFLRELFERLHFEKIQEVDDMLIMAKTI